MKEIKLSQGKTALIDDEDFEAVNKFKRHAVKFKNSFYARTNIQKEGKTTTVTMHRMIMGLVKSKVFIDHKDRNGLNNQRHNIRVATYSQNNANKVSKAGSSSIFLGVFAVKNKWRVKVTHNNKKIHIGYYTDEIEAAKAYNKAALKYHGQFANLNAV